MAYIRILSLWWDTRTCTVRTQHSDSCVHSENYSISHFTYVGHHIQWKTSPTQLSSEYNEGDCSNTTAGSIIYVWCLDYTHHTTYR